MATPAAPSSDKHCDPLSDAALIARLLREVTGRTEHDVVARLRRELREPGITVAEEAQRRGVMPYIQSSAMDALYSGSDAFLYESAVWNANGLKRRMRKRIRRWLRELGHALGRPSLDVLVIGDGPGFDSLELTHAGHAVTYHELPGFQEQFARRLFEHCAVDVRIVTDRDAIAKSSFDAVVCLDVLEHVEDPPAVVASLVEHLRPGGALFVHAPFYMIHRAYPTHLLRNRRLSGSMKLYRRAGLQLIQGSMVWDPLVFAMGGRSATLRRMSALRRFAIWIFGVYLSLGRIIALAFIPIHWVRRWSGRWFEKA